MAASSSLVKRISSGFLHSFLGIFFSRIFGLVRDIAMAGYWGGTGAAQAAIHIAFSIPNLFRGLFGEGAFSAAFVPALTKKLDGEDRQDAWRLAERSISLMGIVLAGVVLFSCFLSYLIYLAGTCGWFHFKAETSLTFKILPLLLPYALLICLTGAFASVLNTLRKFGMANANPIIFNVVQLCTLWGILPFWKNDDPTALYIFCGSVLVAGILQVFCMMLLCRKQGFHFHFSLAPKDPDIRALTTRFLQGCVGAGMFQLNQLIDKGFCLWLGAAAVSGLALGQRIVNVPVGFFGVALSQVCLQAMSKACAKKNLKEMSENLNVAIRQILFLSLPFAALLAVLAAPCIRVIFLRGAYTEQAAQNCVFALRFFVLGLPAFCLYKVATNPHHAFGDTKTAVHVSLWGLLVNFSFNLLLVFPLKQGGLALASVISSWFNVITLFCLSRKLLPNWQPRRLLWPAVRLLAASMLAALAAWGTLVILKNPEGLSLRLPGFFYGFSQYLRGLHLTLREGAYLLLCGGVGGVVYLLACVVMRAAEPHEMAAVFHRGRKS